MSQLKVIEFKVNQLGKDVPHLEDVAHLRLHYPRHPLIHVSIINFNRFEGLCPLEGFQISSNNLHFNQLATQKII